MRDWSRYFEASLKRGPNPFYQQVEPYLSDPGKVIELGFGSGMGVGWWLERGWQVHAIDKDETMCRNLGQLFPVHDRLIMDCADFIDAILGPCDVVSAVFSLFFCDPEEFETIWSKIEDSVITGGLLVGQLLGPNDDWARDLDTTAHTLEEVQALLKDFSILEFREDDRDGHTVYGEPKHWHIYHVIARKL